MHFFAWSIDDYKSLDARIFQLSTGSHIGKIDALSEQTKNEALFFTTMWVLFGNHNRKIDASSGETKTKNAPFGN